MGSGITPCAQECKWTDYFGEPPKLGFDHSAGHPLLFLDDAKASSCLKNNGFKDLGNYSEWPQVAGAVSKASYCLHNTRNRLFLPSFWAVSPQNQAKRRDSASAEWSNGNRHALIAVRRTCRVEHWRAQP